MFGDWLRIPALKRVLQNFMVLAGGRAAGGVLGFISTLLSARALGPEDFGVVAMISAYVLVVRGFCNIKPFEAIVRYGVALADDHDLDGLARLLRVSLVLDAVSALSGTVLAVLVAWLAGPLMDWSASTTTTAMWFSLILLGSGTATASGSLRIFDRFDAISRVQVISSVWRLAGVVLVTQLGMASVGTIAAVWASAQFAQYVGTLWYGAEVVFARLPWKRLRGPLDLGEMGRSHPGIWSFLKCERLDMAVFVHALHPVGAERLKDFPDLVPFAAFPLDTGLAAMHLIRAGVLERHARLRIGFSHGGGAVIPLTHRLKQGWLSSAGFNGLLPHSPHHYAARCYYDSLVYDVDYLRYLMCEFAPGQVFAGSDYPYAIAQTDLAGFLDAAAAADSSASAAVSFLAL